MTVNAETDNVIDFMNMKNKAGKENDGQAEQLSAADEWYSRFTPEELARVNELKAEQERLSAEIDLRARNNMEIPGGLRGRSLSIAGELGSIYMSKWTQEEIDEFNESWKQHDREMNERMHSFMISLPRKAEDAALIMCDYVINKAEEMKTVTDLDAIDRMYDDLFYVGCKAAERFYYLRRTYELPEGDTLFTAEEMLDVPYVRACELVIETFTVLKNQLLALENSGEDKAEFGKAITTIPCLWGRILDGEYEMDLKERKKNEEKQDL